jgi:hypothetical protein
MLFLRTFISLNLLVLSLLVVGVGVPALSLTHSHFFNRSLALTPPELAGGLTSSMLAPGL